MTDDQLALIALNRIEGLGPTTIHRLCTHFQNPQAVFDASFTDLISLPHVNENVAKRLLHEDWRYQAMRELEKAEDQQCHILTWDHPDYPRLLKAVDFPPPVIYVKGRLAAEDHQALALVGCRKPTAYGQQAAKSFTKALVKAGFTIVSGLAYGIDRVAHETALEQGGRTLAVVAHGVDGLYPQAHRSLRDTIITQGAVISEFPLGTPALAQHFPRRNRLISGLAQGVLVIEAAQRSGALITAKWAGEQGREVFALPGPYFSAQSQGCHNLIADGAKLVTSLKDIVGELPAVPIAPPQPSPESAEPVPLGEQEAAIVHLLQVQPLHIDQLSQHLECPVQDLFANLLTLELKGIIIGRPGQHYQLA